MIGGALGLWRSGTVQVPAVIGEQERRTGHSGRGRNTWREIHDDPAAANCWSPVGLMAAAAAAEGRTTPNVHAAMSVRLSASASAGNRNDAMCRGDPIRLESSTSGGDDVTRWRRLYRLRHG